MKPSWPPLCSPRGLPFFLFLPVLTSGQYNNNNNNNNNNNKRYLTVILRGRAGYELIYITLSGQKMSQCQLSIVQPDWP